MSSLSITVPQATWITTLYIYRKVRVRVSTRTIGDWTAQVANLMTTVLLVDDDPLHAYVRRSLLESHFRDVQRARDAAEAFIMVEEPRFAERLGLVVVGLNRPGM